MERISFSIGLEAGWKLLEVVGSCWKMFAHIFHAFSMMVKAVKEACCHHCMLYIHSKRDTVHFGDEIQTLSKPFPSIPHRKRRGRGVIFLIGLVPMLATVGLAAVAWPPAV